MRGDRGSAAVLGVAVLGAAVAVGLLLTVVAGAVADRARARSAADLSALAGAYAVRVALGAGTVEAVDEPCAVARRTAAANGATLTACTAFGDGSVQVTAASGRGKARARAGPEMEGPGGVRAEGAEPPPG
mgnify:CR=1 FL=1